MPPLTRAARPLLNIVRGKPHATEEDHEITTRSPKFSKPSVITNGKLPKRNKADDFAPRQGEDKTGIYDSPESSADELNSPAYVPPPGPSIRPPRIVSKAAVVGDSRSKADAVTNVSRIVDDEKSKKQEYGSPKRSPPAKIPPWMVASPNKKRRKKPSIVYTTTSQKAKLKLPAYTEKPALVEIKPAILFKRPNSSINVASSRSNSEASEIVFVRPTINNESHLNTEVFEADDLPSHTSPLSSPEPLLSSPPSSTVEENLLEGKDFPDHEFCTICGSQVSRAFRIAWEDENCQGGRMTLKKQELFCQTHTRAKAKEAWAERRYPTVNWTALPDRLRRYRASVAEVLRGNHRSTFQDAWEELVRTTESRTIQKVWQSDLVSKTWSGYYGSKGSRIISEFAFQTFQKELQLAAIQNKLIAKGGVSGGIAGYVQAVVVPEFALNLIMEDMGIDRVKAEKILYDSSDLGDVLNIDDDDQLPQRPVTPPLRSYGEEGSSLFANKSGRR